MALRLLSWPLQICCVISLASIFTAPSLAITVTNSSRSAIGSSTSSRTSTTISSRGSTLGSPSSSSKTAGAVITPAPNASGCVLACGLFAHKSEFWWHELDFSTTITAATRLIIIDEDDNSTSTSLIFDTLPDGYTLPPMNEQGTQTWDISYTGLGGGISTTKLTWPTRFVQYAYGYEWAGTFPSTDIAGNVTCLSADREYVPYPITTTPAQPIPSWDFSGENGLNYIPMRQRNDGGITRTLNPTDSILQSCEYQSHIGGVAAAPTAQFLTVTSTTKKKKSSVPTQGAAPLPVPQPIVPPEPIAPPPTQAPPPPAVGASQPDPPPPAQPAPAPPAPNEPQPNPVPPPPVQPVIEPPSQGQTSPTQVAGTQQPDPPEPAGQAGVPTPASPGGTAVQAPQVLVVTTITGVGFSFTLPVPAASIQTQPIVGTPQAAQTVVNGVTFVPIAAAVPGAGTTLQLVAGVIPGQANGGPSGPIGPATVINGQTFVPIGTNQAAMPPQPTPAPSLVLAGSTFSAVGTVAGVGAVFNVAGQALTLGSTITLGMGQTATTVALQTDALGNTVLVTASAGQTRSTTVVGPRTASATNISGIGDFVGSGIGGTRTSTSSIAQQTANAGVKVLPCAIVEWLAMLLQLTQAL